MSGIAAVYDATGAAIEPELLAGLVDAIGHRGPKSLTWTGPGAALGQRVLATTLEQTGESLPISVAGGRLQIAFDGRLDNRKDLLAALGPSERIYTDPELVVLAHERWGDAAPGRLLGDFAYVLWESARRRLLAVRDQRGFRPLVYARHGRRFVFGSEARQLFAYPDVARTVDAAYLACHLTGALPRPGSTPYAAISEVPAGHYLVLESVDPRIERYWRGQPGAVLKYRRDEEYVEHFESVFGEAVGALTRSVKAPAILLSGGLDSSYVTARALEQAPQTQAVHGFVPGSTGLDEREHARAVATHLEVRLVEADVSDCWSLSSELLPPAAFDQPSVPMQAPMMIKLSRVAAEAGSSVLLDGVGGDEFLSGSESYIASLLLAGRPLVSYREAGEWAREIEMQPATVFARAGLLQLTPMSIRHRFRALRGRPSPQAIPPWIDPFSLRAVGLEPAIPNRDQAPHWQRGRANAAFWETHNGYSLPILGWRERFAGAAQGVEIRSPFWDLRVIELLARMPAWVHRSAGHSKALLRAAMRPRLPAQVVDRQDKGVFDELMDRGVLDFENSRVDHGLSGPLTSLLYLKPDALRIALDQYRENRHRWWHPLWQAITAGLWLSGDTAATAPERPVDEGTALRVPAEVGVPRSRS